MKKILLALSILLVFASVVYSDGWFMSATTAAVSEAEYIIPGSGIVNDTDIGYEVIIPGSGIYNQQ